MSETLSLAPQLNYGIVNELVYEVEHDGYRPFYDCAKSQLGSRHKVLYDYLARLEPFNHHAVLPEAKANRLKRAIDCGSVLAGYAYMRNGGHFQTSYASIVKGNMEMADISQVNVGTASFMADMQLGRMFAMLLSNHEFSDIVPSFRESNMLIAGAGLARHFLQCSLTAESIGDSRHGLSS